MQKAAVCTALPDQMTDLRRREADRSGVTTRMKLAGSAEWGSADSLKTDRRVKPLVTPTAHRSSSSSPLPTDKGGKLTFPGAISSSTRWDYSVSLSRPWSASNDITQSAVPGTGPVTVHQPPPPHLSLSC